MDFKFFYHLRVLEDCSRTTLILDSHFDQSVPLFDNFREQKYRLFVINIFKYQLSIIAPLN